MKKILVLGAMFSIFSMMSAPFAYVTTLNDNAVTVIDLATQSIIAVIPVGNAPRAIVITPDGTKAYVVNDNDNTVTVIDTATNKVIATVAVGNNPLGLAVTHDGRTVWIAEAGANTITPIDTATNMLGTSIMGFNSPRDIAISPNDTIAYVTNFVDNSVTPVDLITGTVGTPIPVGLNPEDIVITPNGRKLYVSSANAGTISVIDTATNTVIETIVLADNPEILAVSFDGRRLYVSLENDTVVVIDTGTDAVVAVISIIGPEGLAFSPCGETLFIVAQDDEVIYPLDVATNTLGTPFAGGSFPEDIAITPLFDVQANVIKNVFLNKVEFVAQLNWNICPPITAAFYRIFLNGVEVRQVFAGSPSNFVVCLPSRLTCSSLELGLFATNGVEITRLSGNLTFDLRKLAKC